MHHTKLLPTNSAISLATNYVLPVNCDMCLASLSTSKCYHVLNRIQINYYIHSSHRFVTRQANGIRRNEPTYNPRHMTKLRSPTFPNGFHVFKTRHYIALILFFVWYLQAIRKHNVYAEVLCDCHSIGLFPHTTTQVMVTLDPCIPLSFKNEFEKNIWWGGKNGALLWTIFNQIYSEILPE